MKKRYFDLTGKKIDPPKVKRESEPSSKDGFSNLTEKPVVKNFAANFIDNKQPVKVIVEKIAKESNKNPKLYKLYNKKIKTEIAHFY